MKIILAILFVANFVTSQTGSPNNNLSGEWIITKVNIFDYYSTISLDDAKSKYLNKKMTISQDSVYFASFNIASSYQVQNITASDFFHGSNSLQHFNITDADTIKVLIINGNSIPKRIAEMKNKLVFSVDGITYQMERFE